MAVKEKLPQGGGLGPVVGGEDHLPVEGEVTCLVSFPVLHPAVCHLQYEKVANTCSHFVYVGN